MEPATPAAVANGTSRAYTSLTVFLAVVATLRVFMAIIDHWKAYDGFGKLLAVILLVNLVAGFFVVSKQLRKNGKVVSATLVLAGYVWLLLATTLFNR